jgi:hypothetical protein
MRAVYFLLCACVLRGQDSGGDTQGLQALTEQLRLAVNAGDWKAAAELSATLKKAVVEQRDNTLAKGSNKQIDRLIDGLPEDTETIVVAHQPFTLSEPNKTNIEQGALPTARGYVLGLLGASDDGQPLKFLYGSTVRFAMLAARKFANHPPDGSDALPLGLIAYQGCGIYAFANPVAQLAFPGLPESTIAAHQVWTATGKQYSQARNATARSETYLMTALRPELILVCNDRDFFSSVVTNLDKGPRGSLLQRLPEWKRVDRSASLWGLRHFVEDAAATDPTYPSNGGLLGDRLSGATGAIFEAGPHKGQLRALWLSASRDNPWEELSKSPDFRGAATVRQVADGIWELSVNDDVLGAGSFAVFAIMAFLGFAVLI